MRSLLRDFSYVLEEDGADLVVTVLAASRPASTSRSEWRASLLRLAVRGTHGT